MVLSSVTSMTHLWTRLWTVTAVLSCDHDGRPIAITNLADSLPDDGDQDLDRTFIYSIEDDRTTNIPDETFINTDEEHGVAEQPNRRNRNRPKYLDSYILDDDYSI